MRYLLVLFIAFSVVGKERPPNIVVIFADDLDADEINCTADAIKTWATASGSKRLGVKGAIKAGSPKVLTPHVDSLAKDGVLFTRFYVNATVCTASRYCLLTGRLATRGIELQRDYPPGTHATLDWRPAILREETCLPKELQKLGYRTGIIGKWHNLPHEVEMPKMKKGERKPNSSLEKVRKFEAKLKRNYKTCRDYLSKDFGWDVVDRMEWGNSIVNLDWQCEGALKFIDEAKDKPFFLYCALPVPHGQYRFGYNDISTYDKRVTSNGILDKPMDLLPSNEDVYKRIKKAGVPKQNAMATRMDDYVGAVLKKLDDLGLRENTLIVFTSDHGNRGKNSCYEGGAKVPMLVSWPGKIKPGSTIDSLCGSVDLAPTLIAIAGGAAPADMIQDGRSLLPQLMGKPEPPDWRKSMIIEAGNSKGIVTRDWKYIANRVTPEVEKKMKAAPRKVFWSGADHHNYGNEKMYKHYWDADQLYDLKKDLYETKNLAGNPEYNGRLKDMKTQMSKLISTLPHTFGELKQ